MGSARDKQAKQSKKEPGFIRRHWKGIAAGVTAVIGFGVGLYFILRGQGDNGVAKELDLPEMKEFSLPDLHLDIPEDTPTSEELPTIDLPRTYTWKEEGHEVAGHIRHYQNGTETYIRPYYKPTGQNDSDAA